MKRIILLLFLAALCVAVSDCASIFRKKEAKATTRDVREILFDRQVEILLDKGYPKAAGMKKDQFLEYINPLRKQIQEIDEVKPGHIPFIIVIPERFVSISKQISLVKEKVGSHILHMGLYTSQNCSGIRTWNWPYLILDVDDGREMLEPFLKESYARWKFKQRGRSGLTMLEGIALLTYYPEILENYFLLLVGSSNAPVVRCFVPWPAPWIWYQSIGFLPTPTGAPSCSKRSFEK